MANGDTKTNQYLDIAANGSRADLPSDACCETRSQTLIREVAERIMDVEDEVQRLENNPDVADIVATYADLQAYDTSQLTDKDVIRVLQDENHNDDSTYYRYSTASQTWTYIGESKQYTDFVGTDGTSAGEAGLVPAPATTDANKYLKSDGSWAAAGGGGIKALTSADYNWPTTGTKTSVALWLLPNGLYTFDSSTSVIPSSGVTPINNGWAFVEESTPNSGAVNIYVSYGGYGSGSTVNFYQVSTPAGSQQSSNKFVKHTDLFYSVVNQSQVNIGTSAGASGTSAVAIGQSSSSSAAEGVAIGLNAKAQVKAGAVAIGSGAKSNKEGSIALGATSDAEYKGSVALGYGAKTAAIGEVNVGTVTASYGYNSTNYRVVSGVHDPQAAHDAATKGYVDNNGPLVLYANFNDFDDQDTITFYEEDTLTTPVTVGTIHAAASSGRDIKIVGRANAENDASERINYYIYRIVYPKVCDDSTMDETGMTMDAIDSYNLSSKVRYSFSTFDGPTSTTFTTERAVV